MRHNTLKDLTALAIAINGQYNKKTYQNFKLWKTVTQFVVDNKLEVFDGAAVDRGSPAAW